MIIIIISFNVNYRLSYIQMSAVSVNDLIGRYFTGDGSFKFQIYFFPFTSVHVSSNMCKTYIYTLHSHFFQVAYV